MVKNKLMVLIIGMFFLAMLPSVMAVNWDNSLSTQANGEHDKLIITNLWGAGSTVAELEILDDGGDCFVDCYATIKVNLNSKQELPNKFDFVDRKGKTKNMNERIYVKETTCIDRFMNDTEYSNSNGKMTTTYLNSGEWKEFCEDEWIEYKNEEFDAGEYTIKLKSKKGNLDKLDWSFEYLGISSSQIREHWAWWDASFEKKRALNFNITGNPTIADMQAKVTITYDSDMQTDFSDIRFTNPAEDTELSYYVESYTPSTSAVVWIRLEDNITTTDQTLAYLYYDNTTTITSQSNNYTTFPLFDDFNAENLTRWNKDTSCTFSGGEVTCAGTDTGYISTVGFAEGYIYEGQSSGSTWADATLFGLSGADSAFFTTHYTFAGTNCAGWTFAVDTGCGGGVAIGANDLVGIARPNSSTTQLWLNNALADTASGYADTNYPDFRGWGGGNIQLDWARVRGFNDTAINFAIGAEEENAVGPTVTHVYPEDYANLTSNNLNLTVTATDDQQIDAVTLFINGAVNNTDTSQVNGTYQWLLNFADGSYTWTVGAEDNDSNTDNMTTYNFNIDATLPDIEITEKNFTYQEILQSNVTLNVTLTEANPDTCWWNYNGTNNTFTCSELGFNFSALTTDKDIWVYMNDTFGNEGSDYYHWNITATPITVRAINYLGSEISSVAFTGDISFTGNPYTDFMSSFINDTNKSINITTQVVDLTNYNQDANFTFNINASNTEYNLSLTPNQLYLAFYNGSYTNSTKFEVYDGDQLFANDSADVLVVQQSLNEGPVYVRFNEDDYGVNWTQFYEYQNDLETHISENLSLIDVADWTIFFTVKSKDNRVIENAVLRAEVAKASGGSWVNTSLVGQRLTQPDGTTFFLFDSSTYATITVTATGYDAQEILVTVGDESATSKATSYDIYLDESDSGVSPNVWIYYPKYVTDLSEDIEGMIMAKGRDQVKINTDYRVSLGLGQRELTDSGRGKYNSTLISGTDFSAVSGDIVVYVYIDGVNAHNWTIVEKEPTNIFDLPTLDTDVVAVVGGIALVFVSGAIGMIFTSATAGFTSFMVGSIFLGLINPAFLWLSLVSLIYFVIKLVSRVMKE